MLCRVVRARPTRARPYPAPVLRETVLGAIPRPTFGPLAGLRSRALAQRAAPAVFARLGAQAGGWCLGEPLAGRGDTCVFAVRDGAGSPALLKATATRQGRRQLDRQVDVLAALHADPRVGPWARLVPRTLYTGEVDDLRVVVEARLPGGDSRGVDQPRVLSAALAAIEELQERTAGVAPVDAATLDRWVHRPAAQVRAVVRGAHRAALDGLEAELGAALGGHAVARAWVHGDYNRTNVLFHAEDGRADEVSGVVDWTEGEPDGLVGADAITLLLWEPILAGGELGPVLLERLADPGPVAAAVTRAQRRVGGPELPIRVMLLLSWLRHVGGNLADSTRYAANPVWMRRNVRTVLAGLGG
jgi:Phosphotransferase enzyme family